MFFGGQHSAPIQLTQQVGPRETSMAALQRGLEHLRGKPVNSPEAENVPDKDDQLDNSQESQS